MYLYYYRMTSCLLDLEHNSFVLEEVINLRISERKGHHPAWITQSGNISSFKAIQISENYILVPCFYILNTRQTSKCMTSKGKLSQSYLNKQSCSAPITYYVNSLDIAIAGTYINFINATSGKCNYGLIRNVAPLGP